MEDTGKRYVICNWSQRALGIIIQLHSDVLRYEGKAHPVTVISTDLPPLDMLRENYGKYFYDVKFHEGDPSDQNVLRSGGVEDAISVVVLSSGADGEGADARTMLTFMALKKLREELQKRRGPEGAVLDADLPRVVLEFRQKASGELRLDAVASGDRSWVSWVHAGTLDTLIFGQAARKPGLIKAYFDLLTFSKTSDEMYRVPVPRFFLRKDGTARFVDIARAVISLGREGERCLLVGVAKGKEQKTNPPRGELVGEDHELLLISKDPPDLSRLFEAYKKTPAYRRFK